MNIIEYNENFLENLEDVPNRVCFSLTNVTNGTWFRIYSRRQLREFMSESLNMSTYRINCMNSTIGIQDE